jgi:RNA polymerase sigma factor for flagellar operon FliA
MDTINEKWIVYKKSKDEKIREELIQHYLPLVKYQVERIAGHLPDEIRNSEKEDLNIEGVIGLIEAIERFEPERQIKFETFAIKRIKGAILDALRKNDILSKNMREKVKAIEKAYFLLESKLGRQANDDEIIKELRMTKEEFYDILLKVKSIALVPLEDVLIDGEGEEKSFIDTIGKENGILTEIEENEKKEILIKFIEQLPEEERIILEMYYWDGLTLKEIGKALNLSESRVCQLHTKIILKLRSKLNKFEK